MAEEETEVRLGWEVEVRGRGWKDFLGSEGEGVKTSVVMEAVPVELGRGGC